MLTLIHGDYLEVSRAALLRLRAEAKNKEIRTLDGRTLDSASLTQALGSLSLFGQNVVVVIENLFSKLGKKTKTIEALAAILTRESKETEVVLWEDQELSKTALTSLGTKVKVLLFKTPVVIFQFLDNLRPANIKNMLILYRQVLSDNAPEVVFLLLVRRVRQLLMLADGVVPPGLQDWQVARLTRQAELFTIRKLAAMSRNLLEREYSLKNGSSPFSLEQLLEQFILNL